MVPSEKVRSVDKPKSVPQQEDDVVGKAYDGRLMRRLITYLYPYKWACLFSLVAILLKAGVDVLGPYLTKVAVDLYMTATPPVKPSLLARWVSPNAWHGLTQIALIYIGSLVLGYILEAMQT